FTRIVAIGAPAFKGEDAGLGTLPASLRKVLVISYAGLSPRPCVCSQSPKGVILPSVPSWRGNGRPRHPTQADRDLERRRGRLFSFDGGKRGWHRPEP